LSSSADGGYDEAAGLVTRRHQAKTWTIDFPFKLPYHAQGQLLTTDSHERLRSFDVIVLFRLFRRHHRANSRILPAAQTVLHVKLGLGAEMMINTKQLDAQELLAWPGLALILE
jgi:hypothetical protein